MVRPRTFSRLLSFFSFLIITSLKFFVSSDPAFSLSFLGFSLFFLSVCLPVSLSLCLSLTVSLSLPLSLSLSLSLFFIFIHSSFCEYHWGFQRIPVFSSYFFFSLSLSLSLTHTHTHTHISLCPPVSFSAIFSFIYLFFLVSTCIFYNITAFYPVKKIFFSSSRSAQIPEQKKKNKKKKKRKTNKQQKKNFQSLKLKISKQTNIAKAKK